MGLQLAAVRPELLRSLVTVSTPVQAPSSSMRRQVRNLSGHTTVIGAVTAALERLDGTSVLDLDLSSLVTGTTRHYELGRTLRDEGIGARIWGGIHFRNSDEVGDSVGRSVGRWAARHLS